MIRHAAAAAGILAPLIAFAGSSPAAGPAVEVSTVAFPAAPAHDPRPFAPDAILSPPGGPELYLYTTGTSDVVALRVSVPLRESAAEAGAGQILRAMAQDRMTAVASRIGARARATRTADALVYEVAGPVADMDFLAWVLREGLREPDPARFAQVRREALGGVERRMETPEGALALRLRERLGPSTPGLHGTIPALERLDHGRLSALWSRTHRRDGLRIVVVGNIAPEVVLASLADLGIPESGARAEAETSTPSGSPIPTPELIRHWLAEARSVEGGRDPRALVASRLIAETVRENPGDYEIGVELWEVDRNWVLVLSGAAYPRSRQAMHRRVEGLVSETLGGVTDESVRRHAAGLRAELLESARTPWGLADVVGHAMDVGEPPDRVQELLASLQALDGAEVRQFIETLQAASPIREEMNP